MFLSKISLKWTLIIPRSLSPLFFQYGMHPFINFGLNFLFFLIIMFLWVKRKNKARPTLLYGTYLYLLVGLLTLQTFFQILMVNITFSPLMQLAGLGMAAILILLYSIFIPALLPVERFVFWVKWISVTLVLASLLLLPILWPFMFKGGRFIGLFKHIPHMVSCSTFAFIFFIRDVFSPHSQWGRARRTVNAIILFLIAIAVILTATKAAFVTIVMTFMCALVLFKSKRRNMKLFKGVFFSLLIIGMALFGGQGTKFLYDITTGKKSFGMRKAQNGIETRLDEVYRGMKSFQKSPYFGKGLLFKFMGGKNIKVSGYNSFKDPHNLFVSAGVIGGWPLLALSVVGYILMIIGSLRGMMSSSYDMKIVGIFLFSHLLVFIIYHAHFSLGGMGDRMYWLIFGYLGLQGKGSNTQNA